MRLHLVVSLLLMATPLAAQRGHGKCSENDVVSYSLRGWVGYTNIVNSIAGMTIECFTSSDKAPIATVKTDAEGRFSFAGIRPGRYYLKGTKRWNGDVIRTDAVVTVSKEAHGIACLVAEAEVVEQAASDRTR